MTGALLNYIPYPYQVFVGNLDCTHAVENFSIQRPRADINQPYSWSGSLTLAETLDKNLLAESLDDLVNPARWAKGVEQVKFYFEVDGLLHLFCTMRILEYFYNESTGVATIELGDVLRLLNYATPAKDYKGLQFPACTSITVGEIVNRAMQEAKIPNYSINQASIIEVAPNKPDGSWISWAQKYLGERGYFLYCLPDETVAIARYPTVAPATALLSRAKSEVEEFERAQSPDIPVEKYIATASPEKFAKCVTGSNQPEIEEEYGYIVAADGTPTYCLERRVTTYPTVSTSNYEKTKTVVEQARGSAFPTAYPGSITMVIVERIDEKKSYDSQNRLVLIERYTDKPLSLVLPNEFPPEEGYTYLINNIEATVEEFSESLSATSSMTISSLSGGATTTPPQSEGIMRRRTKTFWSAFPIGLQAGTYTGTFGNGTQTVEIPFGLDWTIAIKEQTTETWKGGGKSNDPNTGSSCVCSEYKYKKRVYQRPASFETDYEVVTNTYIPKLQLGALQLKSSLSRDNDGDTPPAWQVKAADCPTCTDVVKGEITLLPVAYTPFVEREKDIVASTVQNQIEAEYLANLIGTLDWSRYHQRQVAMPVPKELLLDPAPFHRIDVHNGAFVADNPIITLGDDGMEFAFIGNYLGAIPEIAPPAQAGLVFNLVG